jgi:hypothetical protein
MLPIFGRLVETDVLRVIVSYGLRVRAMVGLVDPEESSRLKAEKIVMTCYFVYLLNTSSVLVPPARPGQKQKG